MAGITVFKKEIAVFQQFEITAPHTGCHIQIEKNLSSAFFPEKGEQRPEISFRFQRPEFHRIDLETVDPVFFVHFPHDLRRTPPVAVFRIR